MVRTKSEILKSAHDASHDFKRQTSIPHINVEFIVTSGITFLLF